MPAPYEILRVLEVISNEAKYMAFIWHILFGALLAAILFGWRPSRRLAGILLCFPLFSVSVFSWVYGNPFNGTTFLVIAILTLYFTAGLSGGTVTIAAVPFAALGAILVAFGWIYPHFLHDASLLNYLYSAPVGLVPCPTLSVIIGLALLFDGLQSRGWALTLVIAGLFYALFGSIRLRVYIDLVMLIGALGLLINTVSHWSGRK